ncbi:hypothetical protein Y032_0247g44, partial [Ancylostoma ceylanicum]
MLIVLLLAEYCMSSIVDDNHNDTETFLYSNAWSSNAEEIVNIASKRQIRRAMDALYSWDPKHNGLWGENVDLKLASYFDFVRKYKAARNLLKKKLSNLKEEDIDAM